MGQVEAFNKRVSEIISDKLNGAEFKLIDRFKTKLNFRGDNYYKLYEILSFKIGIIIGAKTRLNKNDEIIGSRPFINFLPGNALEEEPHIRFL